MRSIVHSLFIQEKQSLNVLIYAVILCLGETSNAGEYNRVDLSPQDWAEQGRSNQVGQQWLVPFCDITWY